MYRRAQRGIGYLPQEPSVFRKLSVEDNILAVLELHKRDPKERHQRLEASFFLWEQEGSSNDFCVVPVSPSEIV